MLKKFLLLSIILLSINLQSKSIFQDKMKKMVKEFENVYKIKPEIKEPSNIAVFSFNCEKKLQSKGVGNAVREILTHYILSEGKFKVIEREEIEKVFDEWKLSLSGAIEEETAIKIGKILGVKFLIVGNIVKIGKNYQITSRMIDVETGEIIISNYTDVDAKTFEEEAKPYLALVPETQAIGLYFFTMLPDYSNSKVLSPDTIQGIFIDSLGTHRDTVDYLFIIKPESPYRIREYSLGGGIKYFPFRNFMINLGLIGKWVDIVKEAEGGDGNFYTDIYYRFNNDTLKQVPFESYRGLYNGLGIKAGINFPFNLTRFFKIYPGAEIEWYFSHLNIYSDILNNIHFDGINYKIDANSLIEVKNMDNIFTLNLGLEFRPQARIGFSIIGKYRFFHEYTNRISIYGLYQDNVDGGNMIPFHITDYIEYFKFFGENYIIDFAFSLYF